jgi:hypothetical protein
MNYRGKGGASRFAGFFAGGSPIGFFGFLGSFMGVFLGDGGSFLSAGDFVFLERLPSDAARLSAWESCPDKLPKMTWCIIFSPTVRFSQPA